MRSWLESAGQPVTNVSTSSTASVPNATNMQKSIARLKSRFLQARRGGSPWIVAGAGDRAHS